MSRHHKRRRIAAIAASVGTTVAFAALGAAGPAMASIKCLTPVFANGSSLQNSAQTEVWLKEWPTHTECASAVKVTYTKTSSGSGLDEFGNNSGVLEPGRDPGAVAAEGKGEGIKDTAGKVLDFYVGTDDPPNVRQLSEAQHAAGAKNGSVEITVPVAQAPVSVILSLPAGCRLQEGSVLDLNNTTIGQLWEGTNAPKGSNPGGIQAQGGFAADTWGAFLVQLGYVKVANESELAPTGSVVHFLNKGPVEEELSREVEVEPGKFEAQKVKVKGEGCEQQIIPQARSAESGTSYAFKTYLSQVNPEVWTEFASDFTNWPSSLVRLEDGNTSGEGSKQSGSDGDLAENTAANPGSVGYADVADAAKNGPFSLTAADNQFGTGTVGAEKARSLVHQVLWAQIQNDGVEPEPEPSGYIDPLLGGVSHAANCNSGKLVPGDEDIPYSYKDTWYGITSTDPDIAGDTGESVYPLCGLTYDFVWHHLGNDNLYGKEGTTAEEVANTTRDLMEYIIGEGQTVIQGNYYSRFPSPMQAHVREGVEHIEK
jgi:hypothetical protein